MDNNFSKEFSKSILALSKRVRTLEIRPFGSGSSGGESSAPPEKFQVGVQTTAVGDRNIRIVTGKLWEEMTGTIMISPFDSSDSSTFTIWYFDGAGDWSYISGEQQILGEYYDDSSGTLAELSYGYYGVYWVILGYDGTPYILLNKEQYVTFADAQKSSIPYEVPTDLQTDAFFVARIIIQKDAEYFSELLNLYSQTLGALSASGTSDNPYAIILYDKSLQEIRYYAVSNSGLFLALEASASGDIILIPPGTVSSIEGDGTLFVSTIGAEKCISIEPGGVLPTGWNELSFDDSSWDDSIAGDGYQTIIAGTERVSHQAGDNPDQGIMLFRRVINITGPITEVNVKGDDYIDAVYINGSLVYENGPANTLGTANPSVSVSGFGNNIIAFKTRNSTQPAQVINYMDLSYEISAEETFLIIPVGVEIIGLGKNSIITGSIENNGILTNIQITGTISGTGIMRMVPNPSVELFSNQIKSLIETGTSPFSIESTTLNTNLNADLLDGEHANAFADSTHTHTVSDITDFPAIEDDPVLSIIEEVGDMIYRKQDIPVYTNYATVGHGASATANSTYESYVAGNAIDENDATFWAGASNPVADDWIYVNLGQSRIIHRFRLFQHITAWAATSYKVQGSDNGIDWTDIVTITVTAQDETIDFASPQTYQYFRFYALAGGGNSWDIFTIELFGVHLEPDNDIARLPIGTEGDVLTVSGGIPAWGSIPAHTHEEADITDLDHDAVKIDGITVDLTGITDGQVIKYDVGTTSLIAGDDEGGGSLDDLTDVDLTDLADDDILVYDLATGTWLPETPATPSSALADLTDVDLTGLADDDILVYDLATGTWLPETPASGTSLTVEEQDGTPTVADVIKIKVTNGTLTDDGSGVVSIDFGSAATDGAAIHDNEANEISAITEKTTPADDDLLIIEDSAASYAKKSVKISNLPSGGGTGEVPPALKVIMNQNFV